MRRSAEATTTVTDLVSRGTTRRSSVEDRVERRLTVLREWLRDGIPVGRTIPTSLNAVRTWADLELEIEPIASPNEFTQTHPLLGPRVRDIAGLLTALRKRFGKPSRDGSTRRSAASVVFDRAAHDRQLEAAVSQWHSAREQLLSEKKRADSAEARSSALLRENAEKDELIADLRRQLTGRQGLRAVQ